MNSRELSEELKKYEVLETDEYNVVETYNSMAEKYDEVVLASGHTDPQVVAEVVDNLLTDKDSDILELGCGTGLCAPPIRAKGFTNIDGIDGSKDMLQKAEEKGIYRQLTESFLGTPESFPE